MMRWITGIPLAVLVILMLLFAPPLVPKVVVMLLAVIGVWEFLTIALASSVEGETVANWERMFGAPLVALGVGILVFIESSLIESLFIFVLFVLSFLMQLQNDLPMPERIRRAAFFFFGVFYCVFFFSYVARLLDLQQSHFWLFLLLAGTFAADTGAYLVGRQWGKHKLAPQISPGKTVEGLFGGILGSVLAAWVVKLIFWPDFSPILVSLLGVGIALIGLLGDLSESLLKRGFGVKDSGRILPGHGGILDRVDALLFNAPWLYAVAYFYFQSADVIRAR